MTYVYLHANLKLKEAALAKTAPTEATPNGYRPDDEVLAFLSSEERFLVSGAAGGCRNGRRMCWPRRWLKNVLN